MALVTRVNAVAAGESEPTERLLVVGAGAPFRKWFSSVKSKFLSLSANAGCRWWQGPGRYEEELDFGNLEGEFAVALATDVGHGFTPNRYEALAGS